MKKRIVILADGTGNAFSTQESNVWRLYCALDKSEPDQVVAYIQGVGTSGFKPFAMLDGATGLGVPSNVRKLYEFICWNWEKDDEIYMFGFSRGAFQFSNASFCGACLSAFHCWRLAGRLWNWPLSYHFIYAL